MRAGDPLAVGKPNGDAAPSRSTGDAMAACGRSAIPSSASRSARSATSSRIVARQQRARIEHGDRGAEPAMRLRQLDADRAAADHDQMLGQGPVGENRLVGQVGQLVEPRDRRHRRMRAGSDDKPPRPDLAVAGAHRARAGEKPRFGAQHGHPEPLETAPAESFGAKRSITRATLSATAAKSICGGA